MVALPVAAMKVMIRCSGWYNGGLCNKKLAELEAEDFHGVVTVKCPRCGTMVEFR